MYKTRTASGRGAAHRRCHFSGTATAHVVVAAQLAWACRLRLTRHHAAMFPDRRPPKHEKRRFVPAAISHPYSYTVWGMRPGARTCMYTFPASVGNPLIRMAGLARSRLRPHTRPEETLPILPFLLERLQQRFKKYTLIDLENLNSMY